MRKAIVLSVVAAAIGITASGAAADPGTGQRTVQFAVSYEALPGVVVTCKGQRIVTGEGSVRDRETCEINAQLLGAGRLVVVPAGTADYVTTVDWYSDYEAEVNPGGGVVRQAVSGTVLVKNRNDGSQVWEIHVEY